ncbi:MAG: TolC family protein [Fimbriimonadaceae bacterium]|nr:TolC family protein [Fimbriimonadaceae bacterium]
MLLPLGIAAWASLVPMTQDNSLTLDQALMIAEKNAFSVRIAASNVDKTKYQVDQAKALAGPKLTLDSTYTRFDKELTSSFGSSTIVTRPIDSKESKLSLSMPLDIAGNISRGIKASRAVEDASVALLQAEKNALRLQVRQGYFQVLQAKAQLDVAEENLKLSMERLENARANERQGSFARVDVLRFETLVKQAESDLITVANGYELAKEVFNNTLGRPIETEVVLVDIDALPNGQVPEGQAVEAAMKFRPDLAAVRYQIESLRFIREAQRSGLQPSLSFSLQYSHNYDAMGFSSQSNTTVGVVTLSIPLYDSGLTRAKVKTATEDEKQAKLRLDQLQLGVSLEVRQALTNLQNAKSRIDLANKQVEFAKETYRLAVVRLQAGEGISVEVTDAQTQLIGARTSQVRARYDYLTAFAQLQKAIGNDDVTKGPRDEVLGGMQ